VHLSTRNATVNKSVWKHEHNKVRTHNKEYLSKNLPTRTRDIIQPFLSKTDHILIVLVATDD